MTAALAGAEVLLTCWGAPPLTEAVLDAAPRLRAVVHAAGSVKHHVTDACWDRGIQVTSVAAANARPVAEYTLAAILFAGKNVLGSARRYRELRAPHDWREELDGWGNHGRTVGIVGASRTGRRIIELLRPFDFEVLLYDPYLPPPPRPGSASNRWHWTNSARAAGSCPSTHPNSRPPATWSAPRSWRRWRTARR